MASDEDTRFKRLAGRRIFITGAASGIGQSIATLFRSEGASLALVDREKDGLEKTARELDALPLTLDLTDADAIEPAVREAARHLGGLDGVVNCAGIGAPTSIEDTDAREFGRYVAINLTAPYLICRAALPYLRENKGSTIVNISSAQALLPNSPKNTAYAATKGGLITFSKSLAIEVAPIRVNVICPGVTRTPMTQFFFDGIDDVADVPFLKQVPLRRPADPIEISKTVLFLSSDESSFVTGVALAVDGGRSLH